MTRYADVLQKTAWYVIALHVPMSIIQHTPLSRSLSSTCS